MSKVAFRKRALGRFFFLFLLKNLPLVFIAGVHLEELNDEGSQTSMRFKWLNKNPFRSMYFAAMHMAAEFATGALLFQYMNSSTRFSMLLVKTEAEFHKKALGKIAFTCNQGIEADQFITKMLNSTDGQTIRLTVRATNEEQLEVATFTYTWACKKKA